MFQIQSAVQTTSFTICTTKSYVSNISSQTDYLITSAWFTSVHLGNCRDKIKLSCSFRFTTMHYYGQSLY